MKKLSVVISVIAKASLKIIIFIFLITVSFNTKGQNLVPNPSFEDTLGCFPGMPHIDCLNEWKDHSGPTHAALNTADLCFNTAVFFPPSSIPAFDGTKYIGVDCQPMNSEYVQVQLTQSMIAGTTYCVSFYVSVCDQTTFIAPSLGARFSVSEITTNPYTAGMSAHVQGVVPFDPTIWTKISGTYTASGGEQYMTLGGFQNNGAPSFVYMYIDFVEVYPMPVLNLGNNLPLCSGETITINANAGASSYLWNTGETTSSITLNTTGTYWVEQVTGSCSQFDTIEIFNDNCNGQPVIPPVVSTEGTLFIPNSFTPNGDGKNDSFGAVGENISDFELMIFNKWGERIFISNNINEQWDGTFHSRKVEQDVYVYKLQYKNADRFIYTIGHVVLIR